MDEFAAVAGHLFQVRRFRFLEVYRIDVSGVELVFRLY